MVKKNVRKSKSSRKTIKGERKMVKKNKRKSAPRKRNRMLVICRMMTKM